MKKKHLDIALSVTSGLLLFALGTGIWLLPAHDFSEEENRALATLPSLTLSSIVDGSLPKSLSAYLTDRLPCRLEFIRLRTLSELSLFKGECNEVLFCRDGYLLDRGEYEDLNKARENLEQIYALCAALDDAETPVTVAYAPRGIDVMEDKLPLLYAGNEKEILELISGSEENIDLVSPLKEFAEKGEAVWYKTDHHWTSHGAYAAYVHLSAELGYVPFDREFFEIEVISEDFLGSIYSRAGCVAPTADVIELYRYEGDEDYLFKADEGSTHNGFYFLEKS